MSTLVVVRHGKSDWNTGLPDSSRPLARRGRQQVPDTAAWIAANLDVEMALVSPATRARETWSLLAPHLHPAPEVRIEDRIYASWGKDLLGLVRGIPDHVGTAALVGHNPSVEELVHELTGRWVEMKTACVAVCRWEGHWSDAGLAPGELVAHGRPPA